ncbi:carbon-nitrogen hydrolase [Tilletiopsis washingtonensis]|uniref:Carbon-nitrogen hydrolase n=1 Tax=Tilletiopsis washingtonensis TaxID=58919 RepID=A0A316Z701_9BASI|nr:carbon-nitrogen hydrolase [Tilletiopsis washingtonensis]PWN96844.1 carbon-nitrogen hydrolase [Tilletiopsis washingtonensis]
MAASPRIAVLQLSPAHGAPLENAARVQQMTSHLKRGEVDLLILPEMALSGYIFPTPASIEPSLERLSTRSSSSRTSSSSPTQALCSSLARRLECYVLCGLPALLAHAFSSSSASSAAFDARPSEPSPSGSGRSNAGEEGAYNAALLLDRTGEAVHVFRKHFLYEADEAWACEGPGFEFVDLPKPLGRLAVGICMDLNPYRFQAAFDSFELASFCVRNHVDTLALPMAWLKPEVEDEEQASAKSEAAEGQSEGELEQDARQAQHQAQQMIHYWLLRLTPLLEAPHRCVVACANRVGQEGGTVFGGSSCVLQVGGGDVRVKGWMCEEEALLVVDP